MLENKHPLLFVLLLNLLLDSDVLRVQGGGMGGDPLPLQQHGIRYPIFIYVILGIVLHHVASNNVT